MQTPYHDKVVWITGASSGIGRAMALELAGQGARLALSARNTERLESVRQEVEALGAGALALPCDVRDEAALADCVRQITARFGRLDVAIANAGFGVMGPLPSLTAADWDRQFAVNVTGVALTAKHAYHALQATSGRMALVGSVAAFMPLAGGAAYASSKAAVHLLGQTLSLEWEGSGVSCTTLHPGMVVSEIAKVDKEGQWHPDRQDRRPANLMWPTDRAAKVMLRAIHRRKRSYIFTGHGRIMAFLGRFLPGLARVMARKMASGMKK
jgi:NAD(P)-dependent dehydrogenase (short-subunit alcohol dehydrogenase family)